MQRFKLFILGILLVPLLLSTMLHVPLLFSGIGSQLQRALFFVAGCFFYGLVELLFKRPMRTYVFGHELTHALACLMMGGSVSNFKVGKDGGSVDVSKNNFWVSLAPYCLPIYTVAVLLIYGGLSFWWPVQDYKEWLWFALGTSLTFHVSLTVHAIAQDQPDIQKTGLVFSFVFILLCNIWLLAGLAKWMFPETISLKQYAWQVFNTQGQIWVWIFNHCKELFVRGFELAQSLIAESSS